MVKLRQLRRVVHVRGLAQEAFLAGLGIRSTYFNQRTAVWENYPSFHVPTQAYSVLTEKLWMPLRTALSHFGEVQSRAFEIQRSQPWE